MSRLYVASENIPAGRYVVRSDANSEIVYGHDPLRILAPVQILISVGIARENLREGFRVAVRDDGVYEDDA